MVRKKLKIGITLGDPAGIGPEVALKAINSLNNENIIPVLIGRDYFLKARYGDMYDEYIPFEISDSPSANKKYIFNVDSDLPLAVPGTGDENTGLESRLYIDKAVELWKSGVIDAIVTGPVNKGLIEKSGTEFSGHTEYIAEMIGEYTPYMMMYSDEYRVLLATTHLPLREVEKNISVKRLLDVIKAGYKSISSIDKGKSIKIAITGLDPHCGDDGAISHFDSEITSEAIKIAQNEGIPVEGPFAADTIFLPEKWEKYNLVIVHYHDQGLIPFKILAFDEGVNVTIGLSITRTSVDHGTAYDIAGKGIAQFSSMKEAIKIAYMLESFRNT